MRRILPAMAAATIIAVPAGITAWAALHNPATAVTSATATPTTGSRARATATPAPKHRPATHSKRAAQKPAAHATPRRVSISGPSVDMDWGPVQVTIIVQGKSLVDVQATAPMERARSNFINSQAIPWLRQETLQAQSANIDLIGGATLTSEAYIQSLQAALDQAHFATPTPQN
jgi:uncharacterized protein with FMN-binding domain